jgi:hypothetical protein
MTKGIPGVTGTAEGIISIEKKGDEIMQKVQGNRYESIPKSNYYNSIVRLLENEYKIIGSHKVVQMIAGDIVELHKDFYPEIEERGFGQIVWATTASTEKKPGYGKKS